MAGVLKINPGTKLRMAFDVPIGQEPKFNMICTFNKSLDESAFLVSIPMVGGKALEPDENQKLLFEYGDGEEAGIIAGYVDDTVKVGIRRFWKVRRVTEHRQFIKRVDVRMKVALPVKYMQDTWALNSDGEIDQELGETMDIFTLPRIGTAAAGVPEHEVAGVICWMREVPKGGSFRYVAGIQLRFADPEEKAAMQNYVAYVKKRYRL